MRAVLNRGEEHVRFAIKYGGSTRLMDGHLQPAAVQYIMKETAMTSQPLLCSCDTGAQSGCCPLCAPCL